MLFGQDRRQMRQFFIDAWRKRQRGEPLQPLEALLADVIGNHPEYHPLFDADDAQDDRDFLPELGEGNPFMHLSLHVALREQLAVDRPAGVVELYQRLCQHCDSVHDAEHRMSEALAETLWESGRSGRPPDEALYLERLRRLL